MRLPGKAGRHASLEIGTEAGGYLRDHIGHCIAKAQREGRLKSEFAGNSCDQDGQDPGQRFQLLLRATVAASGQGNEIRVSKRQASLRTPWR